MAETRSGSKSDDHLARVDAVVAEPRREEYVAPARTQVRSDFWNFIPAVREARQQYVENDIAQRQIENQERLAFNTQASADNARQRAAQEGGVRLVQDILSRGTPEEQDEQLNALVPALARAFNTEPAQIMQYVEAGRRDPQVLATLQQALADPEQRTAQLNAQRPFTSDLVRLPDGSYARNVIGGNGRATLVPVEGTPVNADLAQQRADIARGNLQQRADESDIDYQRRVREAQAIGTESGEILMSLEQLDEATKEVEYNVEMIEDLDLSDISGAPTLRSMLRGGFGGLIPPWPGSEPADTLGLLRAVASQARLAAFESLKGAGQITEAESLFGQEAQGNIDRLQSPEALRRELRAIARRLRGRVNAQRRAIEAGERRTASDAGRGAQPRGQQPQTTRQPAGNIDPNAPLDDLMRSLGVE